jgi:hypothetical protein
LWADFPAELKEVCNLSQLRLDPRLIDPFLLQLGTIIYRHRNRYSTNDYFDRVEQFIRSTNAAADNIDLVIECFGKMDIAHINSVLSVAIEIFPRPFFEKQDLEGFFRLLGDIRVLMMTLNVAVKIGTGVSGAPRGKGRPPSPYMLPALELIEAWESITAKKLGEDSPVMLIKRIPTPKRLDTSGPKDKERQFETKQPSTEFIRLALRMIKPDIKDSEVLTAIKRALKLRDTMYDFVRSKPPKSLLRQLELLNAKYGGRVNG